MKEKICPLAKNSQYHGSANVMCCDKDQCGFWCNYTNQCSIESLAESIFKLVFERKSKVQ